MSLRLAREADCRLIWQWANEPQLRAVSFQTDPIPWEDHVNWFRSKLASHDCLFYVATLARKPVGQVRFDCEDARATISIGLDRDFRGKGLGSRLIRLASERLFEDFDAGVIEAYIKPDNVASIRAFSKAGYTYAKETEVKGHQAVLLVLRKDKAT